jgi:hypothetical protein
MGSVPPTDNLGSRMDVQQFPLIARGERTKDHLRASV